MPVPSQYANDPDPNAGRTGLVVVARPPHSPPVHETMDVMKDEITPEGRYRWSVLNPWTDEAPDNWCRRVSRVFTKKP